MIQIFEGLVFADTDGKIHPWLAESWQRSEDGKAITLKLRRGVKFHDGTAFDAAAVKFTFDTIADPKLASQQAVDLLGPYESTEVVDSHTVRIRWKQPFAPALANLGMRPDRLGIVSPTAVRRLGDEGFSRSPVGTGPFRFVEWVPRVRVVLERNPDYKWAPKAFSRQGPPRLARIVVRIIPEASSRVAALERREIDIAESIPAVDVERFKSSRDFDVSVGYVTGLPESLVFNTTKAPTDDVRVRKAIMYAVDRPQLVKRLFLGTKEPAFAPITSTVPGYWKGAETLYRHDPEQARRILQEAGWVPGPDGIRMKDGKRLELFYPNLTFPEVAVSIQDDLRKVGIQLAVERVTKPKQDEYILNNEYHVLALALLFADPSGMSWYLHSRNTPSPGKFKFGWSRHRFAQIDRLLDEADTALDPERRTRLVEGAQKIALDRALIFPVHPLVQVTAFHKSVQGLKFARTFYQYFFYDVTVAR
jgi:peptide/nickel transport system substrate-binding protein